MPNFQDKLMNESQDWLRTEIEKIVTRWKEESHQDYWRKPLVNIAAANDPLFDQLKVAVGSEHAMPEDLLQGARSVVVFFLPFQPWLGKKNTEEEFFAAREWAESYVTTNQLIAGINTHLKNIIEKAGYAVSTTPATHNFDQEKLISGWSHKHLAYIAGLGTFGLNQLLITEAGCCGRLGSLVTSMPLPETPRPQREWCLEKAGHSCHVCVSRCRYEALHKTRFDRHACYQQCLKNNAHYTDLPLVDVCGKCACEVPCSYRIPEQKSGSSGQEKKNNP